MVKRIVEAEPPRGGTLYNTYRPQLFKEVIGQEAVVKALVELLRTDAAHTFLFTGPSGVGKTTLARLSAKFVRCAPQDIVEIAAAVNTGVDAMREIQTAADYQPFGGESKAIILDEVQRLSKPAWESLLKALEEPSPHTYWFLCTTEPDKVPKTITTRAASFKLKPVADAAMRDLLADVCNREGIELAGDVDGMLISKAAGSPRQLLSDLAIVRGAKDKREAAELLSSAVESEPVRELCRLLTDGKASWQKAMAVVSNAVAQHEPEEIRILVCRYMAAVAINASSDRAAGHALMVLDYFRSPFFSAEGNAPLILAIGNVLLANR
jgi:DNA polymerase III gamma/tau subunit